MMQILCDYGQKDSVFLVGISHTSLAISWYLVKSKTLDQALDILGTYFQKEYLNDLFVFDDSEEVKNLNPALCTYAECRKQGGKPIYLVSCSPIEVIKLEGFEVKDYCRLHHIDYAYGRINWVQTTVDSLISRLLEVRDYSDLSISDPEQFNYIIEKLNEVDQAVNGYRSF